MNYLNPAQSAQGLASLGRGNDSMLMHVTPREVAGLQTLAMAAGGSLTTNPHTGLPEAGFFDFVGDYIVPAALTLAGQPELAVAYSGGKSFLETGDPLQAALAAGMQYGSGEFAKTVGGKMLGGNLVESAKVGADIAANATPEVTRAVADVGGDLMNIPGTYPGASLAGQNVLGTTTSFLNTPATQGAFSGLGGIGDTISQNLSNMGAGLKTLAGPGGIDKFVKAAGGPGSALFQAGSAAYPLLNAMGPAVPGAPESPYKSFDFTPVSQLRARNQASMGFAGGGITSLNPMHGAFDARLPGQDYSETMGLYAKGGYLDGAGDGMSDSIPATIEGKQPARLADGEFVVPADVVSHLGNGSTKAGAKRLYAMMSRVRKARTGTTKQGKQIKADKYLPK